MRSSLFPGGSTATSGAGRSGRPVSCRARLGHPGSGGNGGERGALHAATRGCLAGTGVCFVSHSGKVYGCGYMPIEAGDLRRAALAEIWQTSELFAQLRDLERLKGKCGRCGFSEYVEDAGRGPMEAPATTSLKSHFVPISRAVVLTFFRQTPNTRVGV